MQSEGIHQNCCVSFAEQVWQQNPAPIFLCAGQARSRISLPRYLAFTNQLPKTLLAENLLQKRLFDTGIETLPATLSNLGESPSLVVMISIIGRMSILRSNLIFVFLKTLLTQMKQFQSL
jgi:hypothetical protein